MYTVKQNDEDIKFLRNLNFQSVLVNDILMHLELKFIEREQCLEKKTFFGSDAILHFNNTQPQYHVTVVYVFHYGYISNETY